MPDTARQNGAETPSGATVVALVNGPELVQMWPATAGKAIYVEADSVDEYAAQGYSLSSVDLADVGKELLTKIDTFKRAAAAFVKSVVDDRVLDPGDEAQYAAAETAASLASEAWGIFRQQALIQCKVVEADPETVTLSDGSTINHDPGQVVLFHPLDGERAFPLSEAQERAGKYGWSKEPVSNG